MPVTFAKVPDAQGAQVAAEVAPVAFEKVPSGHSVQADAPPVE